MQMRTKPSQFLLLMCSLDFCCSTLTEESAGERARGYGALRSYSLLETTPYQQSTKGRIRISTSTETVCKSNERQPSDSQHSPPCKPGPSSFRVVATPKYAAQNDWQQVYRKTSSPSTKRPSPSIEKWPEKTKVRPNKSSTRFHSAARAGAKEEAATSQPAAAPAKNSPQSRQTSLSAQSDRRPSPDFSRQISLAAKHVAEASPSSSSPQAARPQEEPSARQKTVRRDKVEAGGDTHYLAQTNSLTSPASTPGDEQMTHTPNQLETRAREAGHFSQNKLVSQLRTNGKTTPNYPKNGHTILLMTGNADQNPDVDYRNPGEGFPGSEEYTEPFRVPDYILEAIKAAFY